MAAALAVMLVILVGGVASARAAGAAHAPKRQIGRGTSTNWSGYAVDGAGATNVTGKWIEPAVKCLPGENSWSSPWVGIDGDNSNTVEQIGTDSDCKSGTPVYYAWYEMYPKPLVMLSMPVHPNDTLMGTVTYAGGTSFALKLTDNTTGASFTTTQTGRKVARSSAEWIMEGPSAGLLSDFGTVQFSGASAAISSATGAQPITMVSGSGTARAQPSALSAGAFSVAWAHS